MERLPCYSARCPPRPDPVPWPKPAADELPYVECSPAGRQGGLAFECVNAEIRDFPTWIIRGRRYEQIMQPDELATRSGFRWEPEAPSGTER